MVSNGISFRGRGIFTKRSERGNQVRSMYKESGNQEEGTAGDLYGRLQGPDGLDKMGHGAQEL